MSDLHDLDLWLCEEIHYNLNRLLAKDAKRPKPEETSTPEPVASTPEPNASPSGPEASQSEPEVHRRKWPKRPSTAASQLDVRLREFLQGSFGPRPSSPSSSPLLLNDSELWDLQEAFRNPLVNWRYKVSPRLPWYVTPATGEIAQRLSRADAARWAELSARFAEELNDRHLQLSAGIEIVRAWLHELRVFLEAMGEKDLLPRPKGGFPTPTNPSPPCSASAVLAEPGPITLPELARPQDVSSPQDQVPSAVEGAIEHGPGIAAAMTAEAGPKSSRDHGTQGCADESSVTAEVLVTADDARQNQIVPGDRSDLALPSPREMSPETAQPDQSARSRRRGRGGRPPQWKELFDLMQQLETANPDVTDKEISSQYNQRFANPIAQGKRVKATSEIVARVRYDWGKRLRKSKPE
ncbi:MAG: hypothetical protein ACLQNE_32855 [Thermoguttaceae bacterium]